MYQTITRPIANVVPDQSYQRSQASSQKPDLATIAATIRTIPCVENVALLLGTDGLLTAFIKKQEQACCHLVDQSHREPDAYETLIHKTIIRVIQNCCRGRFPMTWIPHTFCFVETLPSTPSKKRLGRLLLELKHQIKPPIYNRKPPSLEATIRTTCERILGVKELPEDQNLFNLRSRYISKDLKLALQQSLGLEISTGDLFVHNTIEKLTRYFSHNTEFQKRELNTQDKLLNPNSKDRSIYLFRMQGEPQLPLLRYLLKKAQTKLYRQWNASFFSKQQIPVRLNIRQVPVALLNTSIKQTIQEYSNGDSLAQIKGVILKAHADHCIFLLALPKAFTQSNMGKQFIRSFRTLYLSNL